MSSWWRSRYQRQRRDAGRCANPLPHRDAGKSPRAVGVAFKATTGTGRPARRTPRANAMAGEPRLRGRRTRSVERLTFRALARTCRRSHRQCCHSCRVDWAEPERLIRSSSEWAVPRTKPCCRSSATLDDVNRSNGPRLASTHPSKTHPTMGFQLWRTRAGEFRTSVVGATDSVWL